MKVTLFGATGKTGQYLIEEGIKRGFELTVFARLNTAFDHPNVRVIRGDLNDTVALTEAIRGADAVLSALGPTTLRHPNNIPITTAMKFIISIMHKESIKRLIAISTGTASDSDDGFDAKIWLPAKLIQVAMPNSYQDIIALAKAISSSDLMWTMVRVAFLNNSLASKKLNFGLYGHVSHSMTISRKDVAIFMFDQILDLKFLKQAPGISSS